LLKVEFLNRKSTFLISENSFKFIDPKGAAVELIEVPSWGFKGKEKMGSARGYIWSRSIPLLKDTLLLGRGPDTFAIYFPQNDYVGKLIAYNTSGMIVDKAHNLYLQTALQTGVLSLVALLTVFVIYIANSLKIYSKSNFNSFYEKTGLGIFLGITGYLSAGFFNDSVVSVAPIFWILLGIGISINLKLKFKKKEEMS